MKSILKYLSELRFLLGENRKRVPLLVALFLLVSALDLIGISFVGSYIALITSPTGSSSGIVQEAFEAFGAWWPTVPITISLGVTLLLVFLIKGVASAFVSWIILRFANSQGVQLRTRAMSVFQNLDYEAYLHRNSSEYVQSIQRYVNQTISTITNVLRLVSELTVSFTILIFLATVNWVALGVMIGLGVLLLVGYDRIFRKSVSRAGAISNDANEVVVQAIQEGMIGLKEIRVLRREPYFFDRVVVSSKIAARADIFTAFIATTPRYLVETAIVFFIVSLVAIVYQQTGSLAESYPVIGMFGIAILRLGPTITLTIGSIASLRSIRHGVRVLYEDLIRGEESSQITQSDDRPKAFVFKQISLHSVFFRYKGSQDYVLRDVSLKIGRGESVGIVGPSGSGKTTLIDLILGLLHPTCGEITINTTPLPQVASTWISRVAYLPQNIFLLDDSVRNNITLESAPSSVDHPKLERALQGAQLLGVVRSLPHGLDTRLGEHGARLSGGQRQRIALARALYHDREVLVLDESTSALDEETEREVVDEIRRLKGEKTLLIIAHRTSTLKYCDRVIRLERGQIVQSGPPSEMISSSE